MKVTRMRKTDVVELESEQVPVERAAMEDVDGCTITTKKELNSYEENLVKKYQLPFAVKTTEFLIIE